MLKISKELQEEIVKYLLKQPLGDVYNMFNQITKLEEIKEKPIKKEVK